MPGFEHRPGFLTPYFFGIDVTFAITKMGKFSTEYFVGEREEYLENRKNYSSHPDFEYASRNKNKERSEYYRNSSEGKLVATSELKLGSNFYNTEFKVDGVLIGTALTEVRYTKFNTTYYVGDVLVGASQTEGGGSLYESTYTDIDGNVVGRSYMFAASMELAATHEFPAVNERIRLNQLNKLKTAVEALPQAVVPQHLDESQEGNIRQSKKLESVRMFSGDADRMPQEKVENKRRRCSIL